MSLTVTAHPLNRAATLRHIATERFKTARLSLLFIRRADATESPLLTLLFAVLRRGSEGYPTAACLNRALDELYGTTLSITNYLHGDQQITGLVAEMPEDCFLPPHAVPILDGVLAIMAELLLHPLSDGEGELRAAAVEAEKLNLCDYLRARLSDTRAYAANRLCEIMCEGEPYGLSIGGTVAGVSAITPAEVSAAWHRLLAEARCEVFYVGRTPADRVAQAFEQAFAAWAPAPAPMTLSRPHPVPAECRVVEEVFPVTQGKLCLGFACGENDTTLRDAPTLAALAVFNELLGGMPTSRLFRYLRETLGLCYSCESYLDMTKGVLTVACGIRSDRRAEAEAAARECLSALQTGTIESCELEAAKLSLLGRYRECEDSAGDMAFACLARLLSGNTTPPGALARAVSCVTAADVSRVAGVFCPDTVYFLRGESQGEGEEGSDD